MLVIVQRKELILNLLKILRKRMERRRGIDLYKPSYWGKNGRARSLSSGEAKEER